MKPRKVRLQDLARSAGVSVATVSRVVNRTGHVSPTIAERVRKAAQRLQVDLLRKKDTRLIAFLLGNRHLLHPFHSRILAAVEAYCAEKDYNVVFLSLHYPPHVGWRELQLPRILSRGDFVDGFILAGVHSQNLLDRLAHSGLPFAVQGNSVLRPWSEDRCDAVYYDDVDGAYQMTRYLQSQGHRAIWFVGNRKFPWFDRCYQAYCRAMADAGLIPRAAGPDSEQPREVGYLATKSILGQGGPVSAIFAGSDPTAQGVYEALRDSGMNVPEDISVAGLDDIEAGTMHPRLTTIHVFLDQVGRQLAEFILRRIAQPGLDPQKSIVPTKLVKGESCGAASSTFKAATQADDRPPELASP